LDTLKYFAVRYIGFMWALVKPLGSWAVFAIAGIDSAFFGIPLDPVVATYVYQDRPRFLLYALMASAGSAVGCILLYIVGYKGGEVLLEKRIPQAKFNRMRNWFDRHEFWALMFPAMMPPPFPFKLFALGAAVFEMNFWHFLLAIFAGRMIRFVLLSVLVLKFGPQAVAFFSDVVTKHWIVLLLTIASIAVLWLGVWLRARRPSALRQPPA
jgi:membrane protein YqaA with SNARE-associated domain